MWARPTLAGTSKSKTRSSNGCEFTFEVKIALAVIFGTLPVNCLLSGFHYFKLLRIVRILPTVASCLLEILSTLHTSLKIVYSLALTILTCLRLCKYYCIMLIINFALSIIFLTLQVNYLLSVFSKGLLKIWYISMCRQYYVSVGKIQNDP